MEHEDNTSEHQAPVFPPPQQSSDDVQLIGSSSARAFVESGNSSDSLYTPQVKVDLIPKLGQEFVNLDEVYSFYNNYAKAAGFSMRIHSSKLKNGEPIRKEYVCYKQGLRRNSEQTKRRRGIVRGNCQAKLTVVKTKSSEKWVVSQFTEIHNHPLATPRKVHLLKSHRRVSDAQRALTQQLSDVNIPTCQQMSLLELQAGGLDNVGFLQQDLYNVERDRRKSVMGHDADLLYEHFELQKQMNPGFVFTFEKDNEGRMTHCFWADATCRKSYKYFGDVVVFDTTYNTNRYGLIFAPICGVNHHRQTTLFGCAFLSDETTDSFEWFFNEWLKAMPGEPPKMIITDQDPAMAKAIANILPTTFHRYCIWHICNKFSEKLGASAYAQYYNAFKECIWNSESVEEFESKWLDIVEKSSLAKNDWLNAMYQIRERWIPAFSKHIFSARMTSSQRSEESHAFFKRYVSPHNGLLDFVTRFDRALARIRHNELDLDHKDVNEKPNLKTSFIMEKRMSELYTWKVFDKFQEEFFQIGFYMLTVRHEDETHCLWSVKRLEKEGSRTHEISVDKSSNYASCSCKLFEHDGIPCRHLLAYFNRMHIMELPSTYILRRWTKAAKAARVMDDLGSDTREICENSVLVRRRDIFQLACNLVDEAILDEEGTEILRECLHLARMKISEMRSSRQGGSVSGIQAPISTVSQPLSFGSQRLKKPLQVRFKGCGSKRMKGGKEKAIQKSSRTCHACGEKGHNIRTCPTLKGTRLDDDDDEEEEEDDDDK